MNRGNNIEISLWLNKNQNLSSDKVEKMKEDIYNFIEDFERTLLNGITPFTSYNQCEEEEKIKMLDRTLMLRQKIENTEDKNRPKRKI